MGVCWRRRSVSAGALGRSCWWIRCSRAQPLLSPGAHQREPCAPVLVLWPSCAGPRGLRWSSWARRGARRPAQRTRASRAGVRARGSGGGGVRWRAGRPRPGPGQGRPRRALSLGPGAPPGVVRWRRSTGPAPPKRPRRSAPPVPTPFRRSTPSPNAAQPTRIGFPEDRAPNDLVPDLCRFPWPGEGQLAPRSPPSGCGTPVPGPAPAGTISARRQTAMLVPNSPLCAFPAPQPSPLAPLRLPSPTRLASPVTGRPCPPCPACGSGPCPPCPARGSRPCPPLPCLRLPASPRLWLPASPRLWGPALPACGSPLRAERGPPRRLPPPRPRVPLPRARRPLRPARGTTAPSPG